VFVEPNDPAPSTITTLPYTPPGCNGTLVLLPRIDCSGDDTIGDLKKLVAAQTGTRHDKIVLKKW